MNRLRHGCRGGLQYGVIHELPLLIMLMVSILTACTMTTVTDPVPTSTPTFAAPAADAPLTVTWAASGDLFAWRSSDQQVRRIASGGVIRPILAPDGEWIVFLRGPAGDPRALWITDTPGANERQLIDARDLPGTNGSRRLNQIVWSPDSDAVYFNTLTGEGMDARPADDLWRVEARTGTGQRLLPDGSGGQITLSPDGRMIALAAAGEYSDTSPVPGQITFYTLATRERSVALDFPAVATASQTRWYPALRWQPDSAGIRAAIPPADLVYAGEDVEQTALWWLPVNGEAAQTGVVDADFFGLPTFSTDGTWIAYLQRRTASDQAAFTLMIAAPDGTDPTVYAEGATLPDWIPGQALFLFGKGEPGELWVGGPGTVPTRFPGENTQVHRIIWADANTYVFAAPDGDRIVLRFGLLDIPRPDQTITTLAVIPPFDAVLPG